MTAHEALREASRRGIVLRRAGRSLRFRGPKDALNEEFKRELVRHKPEILKLLGAGHSTYPCSTCGRFRFIHADMVCYWCRRAADLPHDA